MYISKLKLKNFRSFDGIHEILFSSRMNFLVGNNNSGKTTVFRAIEFLQNGRNKLDWVTKGKEDQECSVEVTFSGKDIPDIVTNDSIKKYQNFIFKENDTYNLKLLRSSDDIKKVLTWNDKINEFENPTGVSNTITALFEAQFVYSDLKNEDYQDFGKTKIVGKLINAITNDFQESESYQNLCKAHKTAFGRGGELIDVLEGTSNKIQGIMAEQYGETKVDFNFGLPEMENFFKNGSINLTENGITTDISQKGTGMQRALAMSLIQIYSESINSENSKQLFFFVDEPETFLHPAAQDKLINSFENISNSSQVFITTHSPYLLKRFNPNGDGQSIKIFSRDKNRILSGEKMDLFPFSPTWGEINYFAFGLSSVEFHNELFGYLQDRFNKDQLDTLLENDTPDNQLRKKLIKLTNENAFNDYLKESGIESDIKYIRLQNDGSTCDQLKTLPMFVRNIIHHPENKNNTYSLKQLKKSIEIMVDMIRKCNES
ncbi:ATP-dependent nuclease [Latilactobacillus fuchuensis]|uniref:ATP-dependent nuclease n=1 Tax=Latilactobacillus fuchuensis TaxID=164393 RepID=UPI0020C7D0C4|nr:ATP-binding protein [Latilactobacillus fuchuensis]MCP8857963.1 ATP-binding protein [Latilactobacillus fuchuensis]